MENLKKELQEKGYTFFKMQDYSEFADEYEYYKKYICNAENNLLNNIKSVRFDGHALTNNYKSFDTIGRVHLDEGGESFTEIENKFITEYLPNFDLEKSSQYWYYNHSQEVGKDFQKFINKLVNKLYDVNPYSLDHVTSLTYYKKDCFLKKHRDGKTGTRICAVLIYLNDEDYKMEWGGNIVFEEKETIPPIYGNIAILDFKEGNCLHEVKKVVDGYGRYAILDFVSTEESTNTPNYY
jgi:Rps23 Pro-64 3,4-dihydroxylase Tpa1-like proline 4-hydroxylase